MKAPRLAPERPAALRDTTASKHSSTFTCDRDVPPGRVDSAMHGCRNLTPSMTHMLRARLKEVKEKHAGMSVNPAAYYVFGRAGGKYDPNYMDTGWNCSCIELDASKYHQAIDDTVWSRFFGNLAARILHQDVGIVIMHPMEATFEQAFRPADQPYGDKALTGKAKDMMRYDTSVALRACEVASTCMHNAVPFVYIRSIHGTELPEHRQLREAGCKMKIFGEQAIITNCDGHDGTNDAVTFIKKAYNSKPIRLTPIADKQYSDKPKLHKYVHFAQHLRGRPAQAEKDRANAEAIGG